MNNKLYPQGHKQVKSKKVKVNSHKIKRAVVLLSGGLDSATTLFFAKSKGYKTYGLIFNYGQRHKKEINQAKKIASKASASWQLVNIELPWGGSSLLDRKVKLPKNRNFTSGIPSTYVPARNIIFLSFAASYAESIKAEAIFIGANVIDYSGYPDCREDFLKSFQQAVRKGTKRGVEHKKLRIYAPLIKKNKQQIIRMAKRLKVPLELTWSCYEGGRKPCGVCDSCVLRQQGFIKAKVVDPAL